MDMTIEDYKYFLDCLEAVNTIEEIKIICDKDYLVYDLEKEREVNNTNENPQIPE